MSTPALLLFAHQARSYAALVRTYTERLGIALVILSSRARDPRDLEQISAVGAARLWHVDDDYLNDVHVEETMAEARAEGFAIVATLATFEGYRLLMARANRLLGATDADPDALRVCMDKLQCRTQLNELGLSGARTTLLDHETLPALLASGRSLFIKPRRGAGSFACFRLDAGLTLARLDALREQMRADLAFRAIFDGQFDFIAEDYIGGDEYSFEVIAADARSYVIGVHAKYLDDATGTTLEMGNSLPAPALSDAQQREGEQFIEQCLAALRLSDGCYHIETRFDGRAGRWDIIEINARMGGALINQSVGVFTGGISMLELWVQALCTERTAAGAWHRRLDALRESTRRRAGTLSDGTVFFSRYGERNRTLEVLSIDRLTPAPDIVDMPVRPHTRLPDSERGIFILNALWKVPVSDIATQVRALSAMLDAQLVVRYSDSAVTDAEPTPQEKS